VVLAASVRLSPAPWSEPFSAPSSSSSLLCYSCLLCVSSSSLEFLSLRWLRALVDLIYPRVPRRIVPSRQGVSLRPTRPSSRPVRRCPIGQLPVNAKVPAGCREEEGTNSGPVGETRRRVSPGTVTTGRRASRTLQLSLPGSRPASWTRRAVTLGWFAGRDEDRRTQHELNVGSGLCANKCRPAPATIEFIGPPASP
jgi:hypothetical protein